MWSLKIFLKLDKILVWLHIFYLFNLAYYVELVGI